MILNDTITSKTLGEAQASPRDYTPVQHIDGMRFQF